MSQSISDEDLANRFTYHPPTPEQIPVFEVIRQTGLEFAMTIVDICPPSRETSLAITKIEEAGMHANAAIARHGLRRRPQPELTGDETEWPEGDDGLCTLGSCTSDVPHTHGGTTVFKGHRRYSTT